MTKPKIQTWATNTNHAAGGNPWSGQPCKVEPSAGKRSTGFMPTERPPAEQFNWLLHQFSLWERWTAALQLETWAAADFSGVTPPTDWLYPTAVCAVPAYLTTPSTIVAISDDGWALFSNSGGRYWVAEGGGANTLQALWGSVTPSWCGLTGSDHAFKVAACDDGTQVDLIAQCAAAPGVWTTLTPATTGTVRWRAVAHNYASPSGIYVIGGHTGRLNRIVAGGGAQDSGVPYAAAVDVVAHTHDTTNPYFLAAVTDRVVVSGDGASGTWTVYNPGWTTFQASDLAYDSTSRRWIAVGMAAAGDLWVSDDNGVTWSRRQGVCPWISAAGRKHISCDGRGGWVVTGSSDHSLHSTWDYTYYSVDNGDTWYTTTAPAEVSAGVVYQDGYFVTVGYTGAYCTPAGER